MSNYYETLGVNSDASPEDIKRAYRSLASKHHPDRGGDTARFQDIQVAYDTLSDPERRRQYDHQLQNPFNNFEFNFRANDFNNVDPFEHFKSIFGFGDENFQRQRSVPRKNRNLRINVEIDLEDTLRATFKILYLNTPAGTKNIRIDLPAGVQSGQIFKYSNLGDHSNPTLPPGDLLVNVLIKPHPRFQISNSDLITILEIDCLDALTGATYQVENLEKNLLSFEVQPGTQPGTKYKMRGQGLLIPNTSIRGDLIVVIALTVKKLDPNSIELVKQIKNQLQ